MMAPVDRNGLVNQARLTLAIAAARAAATSIRLTSRGGGTAAPGLVAGIIDPDLASKLARRLSGGVIVVAGTNGKTTTCRMLATVLEESGRVVIHNRSGSNLVRGVNAAFAGQSSLGGTPRAGIAVIESDEAALPEIVRLLQPRLIVLTNLFRDQLDRYGELKTIANLWQRAFLTLPPLTTILVNADDPTLVEITTGIPCQRLLYGLQDDSNTLAALPHAADATTCYRCGKDYAYRTLYLAHLGDWYCPACGEARPSLDFAGEKIELQLMDSLQVTIAHHNGRLPVKVEAPGLYNTYNVVAAAAASVLAGVAAPAVIAGLAAYEPAFGRIERLAYRGRRLTLVLAKNPVGFNEVLRTFTGGGVDLLAPALIGINDRTADGRDVSWLWDVDFELLAAGEQPVSTTGLRSADMANRLKYAGLPEERIFRLPEDFRVALDRFVDSIPEGDEGYLLMTYTALLDLRKVLSSVGAVNTFWKQ